MDVDSDRFAVRAAQGGSEEAWQQLFERHFDAVYRFCVAIMTPRHDLAEELTQQVFVTAARKIRRFDPQRGSFRGWLFGVAKNHHMTINADELRRRRHETSSVKRRTETAPRRDSDLEVHEALARLPSHYRTVLDAKYLRGLTVKEIANNSRASVEAIESLLRRARARFAREYDDLRTLA